VLWKVTSCNWFSRLLLRFRQNLQLPSTNWANRLLQPLGAIYRGAGKSLAIPGRKRANVSVRMAWISFGALPCKKKNWLELASRCRWNRAPPPLHTSELVSFLVGLRTYENPGTKLCELTSQSTVIFIFMAASMTKRTKEFYLHFPPEQCLPNLFTRGPPFGNPGSCHPGSRTCRCSDDRYPELNIWISELILDSCEYIPVSYVTKYCMIGP